MPPAVNSPQEMRVIDFRFEPPSKREKVKLFGDGNNTNLEVITVTKEVNQANPPSRDTASGNYTPGTRTASVTAGFDSGTPTSTWEDLMVRLDQNVDFIAELKFTGSGATRSVNDLNFKNAPPQLANDTLRAIQRDMRAIRDLLEASLGEGEVEIVLRRKHHGDGQHSPSDIRDLAPQPRAASESS